MPPEKNDWAAASAKVAIKLITTGNVVALILLSLILSVVWRLNSSDLREVLSAILSSWWLGVSGWLLFFMAIVVARAMIRMQGRQSAKELDRMARIRNLALQANLDFSLESSKKPPTSP